MLEIIMNRSRLINLQVLRKLFYTVCFTIWAILALQLSAQEQSYLDFNSPYAGELVLRPFLREIQGAYGIKNVRNEFFNSLVIAFDGLELNLRYPHFTKKNNIHIQSLTAKAYSAKFPLAMQYVSGHYQYSVFYDLKFLSSLQSDLHKIYLGFNVGSNLGMMLASGNVNNQLYPILDLQSGLSILDIWQFKARKKPLYIQLLADLDILGMTFLRPLYLTLGPEFLVENLRKTTGYVPVSGLFPHNYQYLHTELKFAYPFVSGKKRQRPHIWYLLATYAFELMNSKVNNVHFASQGHSFFIGVAKKLYD